MSDPLSAHAVKAQTEVDPRLFLPVAEFAVMFGISKMTVYRRIRGGLWPSGRVGSKHVIPRAFADGLQKAMSGRKASAEKYAAEWMAREAEEIAS